MRYFPLKLGIAFFSMIFGPLPLRADEREKEKTNDAFESFAFIRNRLENEGTLILLKEPKYECVRRIENVALTAGERNFKWDELMKRRGVDDALIKGPSKVEWSVLSLRSIQGIKQNDTGNRKSNQIANIHSQLFEY